MERYSRDGLTFDLTDRGDPDAPAVVLLHGFPANRTSWDDVSDRLVASGLRTLAPDQRGYSPGARPTSGYPAAYRIQELVADIVALLDAAGLDRAHLVGHDWGGGVAWAMAGSARDRVTSLTALSTPHPAAMMRAMRDPWQSLHSAYMAFFQLPRLPELALERTLERTLLSSGLPRPIAEQYAGRMREPGALRGALGWYRALRLSRGSVHRVEAPTTFVWGRHDPFLGRHAAETTGGFVRGDYRFVEVDEGHWLPELQADLCATEIAARVTGAA